MHPLVARIDERLVGRRADAPHRVLHVPVARLVHVRVQRAFEAVQAERDNNPSLQPLGVLVNRFRARSAEHEFRLAELRELFGPLVLSSVLPDRTAVQQAQGAGVPIQRWDTPGAREIAGHFDTLLGRIVRSRNGGRRRP